MEPTSKAKGIQKQLKNIAVLLLVMGIAVAWLRWRIGGESEKIQQFCAAAQGKALPQLNADIEKLGLRATIGEGSAIIHGKNTFGRVACLLEYEGDTVKKAQFDVSD